MLNSYIYIYAQKANKYFFATITWLLISVPNSLMLLHAGTHVLIIAVSISIFAYFSYLKNHLSHRNIVVICLAVVSAFLGATNTMFLYSCIIPVFVSSLIFWKTDQGFSRICLLYSVLSFSLAKLAEKYWVYKRGGISLGNVGAVFINGDQLGANILNAILNIGRNFHIDMWGKRLFSLGFVEAFIGLVILLFLINKLRLLFKRSDFVPPAFFWFCFSMAVVNILSLTLSPAGNISRGRPLHLWLPFYMGFVFCGVFAWIHSDSKDDCNDKRFYVLSLIIASLFWSLGAYTLVRSFNGAKIAVDYRPITAYLMDNDLTDGYGNYWLCSTVEYQGKKTNNTFRITPLTADDKGWLLPNRFMTKESHIQREKNFYLWLDDPNMSVTEESLLKNFGEWKEKKDFGQRVVLYVWDKPFLAGRPRLFERLQSRMRIHAQKNNNNRDAGDTEIELAPTELLFGPYIELLKGRYSLRVDVISNESVTMEVTANCGKKRIEKFDLVKGINHCEFTLDSYMQGVEFLINNDKKEKIVIKDLYFEEMPNE